MERRFNPSQIEVRAADDGQPAKLVGYAAVFDQLSVMLYGRFRERISRGAFAGSLAGDVRALWNHDANLPLGRTTAGTLTLAEDAHGLRVEIMPPATQAGRDAIESIRRGDVDQMSFAFEVLEDDWDQLADGTLVRTLRKAVLLDVSPVVFPAYPGTTIAARDRLSFGDMPAIPELISESGSGDVDDGRQPAALAAIRRRRLALLAQI
jgi:uncharacterized protein